MPFLRIKDCRTIQDELRILDMKNLDKLSLKQIDKLKRNSYFSAGNNRAKRERNGVLKSLYEHEMIPLYGSSSDIYVDRTATGEFSDQVDENLFSNNKFLQKYCKGEGDIHKLYHCCKSQEDMLCILRGGFILSTGKGQGNANVGSGVYFSKDYGKAHNYGDYMIVLELEENMYTRIIDTDHLKPELKIALIQEASDKGCIDLNDLLGKHYNVDVIICGENDIEVVVQNLNIFKQVDPHEILLSHAESIVKTLQNIDIIDSDVIVKTLTAAENMLPLFKMLKGENSQTEINFIKELEAAINQLILCGAFDLSSYLSLLYTRKDVGGITSFSKSRLSEFIRIDGRMSELFANTKSNKELTTQESVKTFANYAGVIYKQNIKEETRVYNDQIDQAIYAKLVANVDTNNMELVASILKAKTMEYKPYEAFGNLIKKVMMKPQIKKISSNTFLNIYNEDGNEFKKYLLDNVVFKGTVSLNDSEVNQILWKINDLVKVGFISAEESVRYKEAMTNSLNLHKRKSLLLENIYKIKFDEATNNTNSYKDLLLNILSDPPRDITPRLFTNLIFYLFGAANTQKKLLAKSLVILLFENVAISRVPEEELRKFTKLVCLLSQTNRLPIDAASSKLVELIVFNSKNQEWFGNSGMRSELLNNQFFCEKIQEISTINLDLAMAIIKNIAPNSTAITQTIYPRVLAFEMILQENLSFENARIWLQFIKATYTQKFTSEALTNSLLDFLNGRLPEDQLRELRGGSKDSGGFIRKH